MKAHMETTVHFNVTMKYLGNLQKRQENPKNILILKSKRYCKQIKYQWKFNGNVATFIAVQTMWQTPPSTRTYGRMLYKPPTLALESS